MIFVEHRITVVTQLCNCYEFSNDDIKMKRFNLKTTKVYNNIFCNTEIDDTVL